MTGARPKSSASNHQPSPVFDLGSLNHDAAPPYEVGLDATPLLPVKPSPPLLLSLAPTMPPQQARPSQSQSQSQSEDDGLGGDDYRVGPDEYSLSLPMMSLDGHQGDVSLPFFLAQGRMDAGAHGRMDAWTVADVEAGRMQQMPSHGEEDAGDGHWWSGLLNS